MTSYPAYTWNMVGEEITIPIYKELQKYQDKFPPVHQLIGAYFGFTGTKEVKTKEVDSTLIDMFKSMGKGEPPKPREI